jgi:hypothetical protein
MTPQFWGHLPAQNDPSNQDQIRIKIDIETINAKLIAELHCGYNSMMRPSLAARTWG